MSWEELMNAVVLIESHDFEFFIVGNRVKVRHNTDHCIDLVFEIETGSNKKDAVYQSIIKFERITGINILNNNE